MDIPRPAGELWAVVGPLLPPRPPQPRGGHPFAGDRAARRGIPFVLWTAAPWAAVLDALGSADRIARERARLDSANVPATRGATSRASTPPIGTTT